MSAQDKLIPEDKNAQAAAEIAKSIANAPPDV